MVRPSPRKVDPRSRTPLTSTRPSRNSRSSTPTSSISAAVLSTFSRTAIAATWTADPPITVCRLAKAPRPSEIAPVSPAITVMSAGSTPSCSAQICASAVLMPCPIATAPVKTETLPDLSMRTVADSNGPRPVPLSPIAMPIAEESPLFRALSDVRETLRNRSPPGTSPSSSDSRRCRI